MKRLIFGGTTEGRRIAEEMIKSGCEVLVCVATETGRRDLPAGVPCRVGRLDASGMIAIASSFRPDEIIDATHPFAAEVSRNVKLCAEALNVPLVRTVRKSDEGADFADAVAWADDAESAAESMKTGSGNVFLATGSNTVGVYARNIDPGRLYVRVLPDREALEKCEEAGILRSHICAMQGPFSAEFNRALYRQWQIEHLVTKDSGQAGGVREKVLPALEMGINVIMIRRPREV